MKKRIISAIGAALLSATILATSASAAQKTIGLTAAKTAALEYAGLGTNEVTFKKARLDTDDGQSVYEIKYVTTNAQYEYDVDAYSGEVLQYDYELLRSSWGSTTGTAIGLNAARNLALADAGFALKDVTVSKLKLEREDGVSVYDVSFSTADAKYSYELLASNGKILSCDIEWFAFVQDDSTATDYVGLSTAKAVALADAGVNSANAEFIKARLDYDDGRAEYEIEFVANNTKYEYEIDALSGKVLKSDVESSGSSSSKNYIGLEAAKAAALERAGLSASEVSGLKASFDYDDGRAEYEVEFRSGRYEYECKVDALSGRILEWDREWDD